MSLTVDTSSAVNARADEKKKLEQTTLSPSDFYDFPQSPEAVIPSLLVFATAAAAARSFPPPSSHLGEHTSEAVGEGRGRARMRGGRRARARTREGKQARQRRLVHPETPGTENIKFLSSVPTLRRCHGAQRIPLRHGGAPRLFARSLAREVACRADRGRPTGRPADRPTDRWQGRQPQHVFALYLYHPGSQL